MSHSDVSACIDRSLSAVALALEHGEVGCLSLSPCTNRGVRSLISRRVFFFQAEDGIRDWSVTGVQTCALPISTSPLSCRSREDLRERHDSGLVGHPANEAPYRSANGSRRDSDINRRLWARERRSEERRVGKECRSRWSPYH